MIEMLEKYVQYGDIHIAARQGFLFKAAYRSRDGVKNVIVTSDRGLTHLYMILLAEISDDKTLKDNADNKYKYPLSKAEPSKHESMIRHSHVELSFDHENELFIVSLHQVSDDASGYPGVTAKVASATNLEVAFNAAITAKQIRVNMFAVTDEY